MNFFARLKEKKRKKGRKKKKSRTSRCRRRTAELLRIKKSNEIGERLAKKTNEKLRSKKFF